MTCCAYKEPVQRFLPDTVLLKLSFLEGFLSVLHFSISCVCGGYSLPSPSDGFLSNGGSSAFLRVRLIALGCHKTGVPVSDAIRTCVLTPHRRNGTHYTITRDD